MNRKKIGILLLLLFVGAVFLGFLLYFSNQGVVLSPKGTIGIKQRNLIQIATLLMLIVVIPVFFLTALFVWKYRKENQKAPYRPNLDHHFVWEALWWALPLAIILVLSILTWKKSHELDPFRPIDPNLKPLTIQVVALDWKWLFLYPEQRIAFLNFVQFPEKIPLHFLITADAPMNSFWIPQLGGQIYAMPGMQTQIYLKAEERGDFRGSSANLSGKGFSGMKFLARSSSEEEFAKWVAKVQKTAPPLTWEQYQELTKPSEYVPVVNFSLEDEKLFEKILSTYKAGG